MRPILVTLTYLYSRVLVFLMRRVPDLAHAERIGVDRPRLFERILMRVFRYRDIAKVIDGERVLYLRRFFLTPRRWPYRIFLHKIARSDDDRAPHSHPFDYVSHVLTNFYVEAVDVDRWLSDDHYVPADIRTVRAGDVTDNPAEHTHLLYLFSPMWTLLLVGRARREWTFVTRHGEVPWREYLNVPNEPEAVEDMS